LASPILTIDQDRLFAETRLGAEQSAEWERQAEALAAENTEIENALIAEESALTEQRAELPPEEFRALADAFDERVQRLRAEQDEKARVLNRQREEERARFFNEIAAVLSEIVREKGAVVVIDRRDVFLSADRIDITDEAIERINETE
jgi:Skp family chaperone for outer membrane proteins